MYIRKMCVCRRCLRDSIGFGRQRGFLNGNCGFSHRRPADASREDCCYRTAIYILCVSTSAMSAGKGLQNQTGLNRFSEYKSSLSNFFLVHSGME